MSELNLKKLRQAQQAVNADPEFRAHGNVDIKLAIKVGKSAFLLIFEGFTCHHVEKINESRYRDADCLIGLTPAQWNELMADLNSPNGIGLIGLDTQEKVISGVNPRKKMDLYRYLTSVEAFLRAYDHLEQAA
jgi:hypothetical protein